MSSQKWEDAWIERLQFLGPERVAMRTWPNSRALKIEAFCDRRTAESLVKRFGGQITVLSTQAMSKCITRSKPPLAIRGKLRIFSDEAAWRAASDRSRSMWIPAGMAFGTGDHATTATCLRLLCDVADSLPMGWRAMDAGTGSGILAIAAEKLGAGTVAAFDFDSACVRIARANARANGCRKIRIIRADARKVSAFARVDVVLANLFSTLLLSSASGFVRKLPIGGWLIFSGILRAQISEVATGLEAVGFESPSIVTRGKWCAGVTRRKSLLTHRKAPR